MSTKNSNDTIWNRTRDLPAGSVVPQPTASTRAPNYIYIYTYTLKIPPSMQSPNTMDPDRQTTKIFAVCYRPGVFFRNPRFNFRKEQFGARFKYRYFNFFLNFFF